MMFGFEGFNLPSSKNFASQAGLVKTAERKFFSMVGMVVSHPGSRSPAGDGVSAGAAVGYGACLLILASMR